MTEMTTIDTLHGEALARAADQAVRAIPPAWPLTATVAVNPFLGQISETLDQTAARLARIGGVRLALPRKHYADLFAKGEITDDDLVAALQSNTLFNQIDLPALKAGLAEEPQAVAALSSPSGSAPLRLASSIRDRRSGRHPGATGFMLPGAPLPPMT